MSGESIGHIRKARGRLRSLAALVIVAVMVACGSGESDRGAVVASATAVAARPAETRTADNSASVDAANAFLDSLTNDLRSDAILEFENSARANWSNLPAGVSRVDRNGVRTGDLDATQLEAMHGFLDSALSARGYETAIGVLGADAFLGEAESEDRFSDQNYWLAFFGEPSVSNVWGWQFGGHHLAINVTVANGLSYMSPTFIGVEPSTFPSGGTTVMPLDGHLRAGLTLINALEDDNRTEGRLPTRPDGIYTGAGADGVIPPVSGSRALDWTDSQRKLLLDAIEQWVGMVDSSSSQARLAEVQAELDDTYLAWHGSGDGPIYYRIQGPSLIIEFSNQGEADVNDSYHYHTIYRDPTNEYGSAVSGAK